MLTFGHVTSWDIESEDCKSACVWSANKVLPGSPGSDGWPPDYTHTQTHTFFPQLWVIVWYFFSTEKYNHVEIKIAVFWSVNIH